MKTYSLTPEEKLDLVMECRTSGLTDHQWCEEKGISKSTFYNWISKFRKEGYPNIPEPLGQRSPHKAIPQEVVKLNVMPESYSSGSPAFSEKLERNAPISNSAYTELEPVIEICRNDSIIRITNDVSPQLLDMVLSHMGGML